MAVALFRLTSSIVPRHITLQQLVWPEHHHLLKWTVTIVHILQTLTQKKCLPKIWSKDMMLLDLLPQVSWVDPSNRRKEHRRTLVTRSALVSQERSLLSTIVNPQNWILTKRKSYGIFSPKQILQTSHSLPARSRRAMVEVKRTCTWVLSSRCIQPWYTHKENYEGPYSRDRHCR